jgi:transposase
MHESTTVTVGLDVHARSIRLAAIGGDELLDERTLPYDREAVERTLRRWAQVRCCYEAGPTGFGLYRHLLERGSACQVVAPGLVPTRPGDRVKADPRDARKLARLLAGGLLEPVWVPSPELEAARDLLRAREEARLDRMRDRHRLSKFCLRHGRRLPWASWGLARRKWLSEQRFDFPAQQHTFDTYLHTVDLVDRRIEELERSIREAAEQGPWRELVARLRCLRGLDTLTALAIAVEIGDFSRFRSAEEFRPSSGSCPRSTPRASAAARARSPSSATLTCAACSSRPPGTRAVGPRSATSSPAASAVRTPPSSSAPGAASSGCTPAGSGWPPAASRRRRSSSLRPGAGRLCLGDRDRATAQERLSGKVRAADAPDHTEDPRSLYAAPAPVGDPRP